MVVQLTSDPGAFLLLRVNQPAGELFDGLFDQPALRDLALQALVGSLELRGALLNSNFQLVTRLLE